MKKRIAFFVIASFCLLGKLQAQMNLKPIVGLSISSFGFEGSNGYSNYGVVAGICFEEQIRIFGRLGYTMIQNPDGKLEANQQIDFLNNMLCTQIRLLKSKYRFSPVAEFNFGLGGHYQVVELGAYDFSGLFKQIDYFWEFKLVLEGRIGSFNLQAGLGWRTNHLIYESWLISGGPQVIQKFLGGWIVSAGVQYVIPMKGK